MNPVEYKTKAHVKFDMKDSLDVSPHSWAENPTIRVEAPSSKFYSSNTHQRFIRLERQFLCVLVIAGLRLGKNRCPAMPGDIEHYV